LFRESFFNRAGSLTCRGLSGTAAWAERSFARRGLGTTLLASEACTGVGMLLRGGYRRTDFMTVLFSKASPGAARGHGVGVSEDPGSWTSAYLRSFYGDVELARAVEPIVSALSRSARVTLLESRIGGATVGVLALFRTPGLIGVYCVGTVPEHRKKGVATSLLARAKEIADSEGRVMVLQTLESDGALGFYLDRGFEKLHAKLVLEKDSNAR
jgi:GNAT superfamily N-acetyltransferase